MNEIEKSFAEEVREKKRVGRNVHAKTGKRGYVGKMRTASDLLQGKARKDYEASSPVEVSSVYDYVMPLEEFKGLPKSKRMTTMYEYRKRHTVKDIAASWDTSTGNVYYMCRALGIAKTVKDEQAAPKVDESAGRDDDARGASQSSVNDVRQENAAGRRQAAITPPIDEPVIGFHMAGEFLGKDVVQKIRALSMMTCEDRKYRIDIKLAEL